MSTLVTLHQVIDDAIMLAAFHDFVARYHAEETLMFWLSVEVFKNRNWKAAKFFGMDADPLPLSKAPQVLPPLAPTPSKKQEIERRKSRKEKKEDMVVTAALNRQRQLDQSAAVRMGVSLEQLYLVKEADFIFDNFIKRDGVYWTCVDADTARDIEDALLDPATLKRDLFEKAQQQAFNGMNDDLMPRFMKEILQASMQDPVPEHLKQVCDRFDELRKAPPRRKTGLSTALAFMFRRTSNEKDSKLQTVSSREMGVFDAKKRQSTAPSKVESTVDEPAASIDATKATNLLRQRSNLTILSGDGGAVGALALSRSRLSYGSSHDSPMDGVVGNKSSLGGRSSGLTRPGRDLRKRISAPVSQIPGDRDSLPRRMEVGLHRSQSDGKILARSAHNRAKELGLDGPASIAGRTTMSKLTTQVPGGESVTVVIEGSRKNSV